MLVWFSTYNINSHKIKLSKPYLFIYKKRKRKKRRHIYFFPLQKWFSPSNLALVTSNICFPHRQISKAQITSFVLIPRNFINQARYSKDSQFYPNVILNPQFLTMFKIKTNLQVHIFIQTSKAKRKNPFRS